MTEDKKGPYSLPEWKNPETQSDIIRRHTQRKVYGPGPLDKEGAGKADFESDASLKVSWGPYLGLMPLAAIKTKISELNSEQGGGNKLLRLPTEVELKSAYRTRVAQFKNGYYWCTPKSSAGFTYVYMGGGYTSGAFEDEIGNHIILVSEN